MPLEYLTKVAANARSFAERAITTSAGVADALKIVATNALGKLDATLLPDGVLSTGTGEAGEALVAGDYVYVTDVTGTATLFKADASAIATRAVGYVDQAYAITDPVTYFKAGLNANVTVAAADVGSVAFLSNTTPGGFTLTAPTEVLNEICQSVGIVQSDGIYFDSHASDTSIVIYNYTA